MALNLKQLATKISGGSPLMEGRRKLETEDVCGIELTLRDFDVISYEQAGKTVIYPVVIFDEINDGYYQGGMQLRRLCEAIDESGMKSELQADGLRMILECGKTRAGQDFVNYTVLD